jgi:hypothetical protein
VDALHSPDRTILAQLRRIDSGLGVEWFEPPSVWAVTYDKQVTNPDTRVEQTATALQLDAAKRGYLFDKTECVYAAAMALRDARIVCYVVEEDGPDQGKYRPLDGRIVTKIQRMNYLRLNCGIKDWQEMMRAKADVARDRRQREESDLWETAKRDRVFQKQMSDILYGYRGGRAARGIVMPANYEVRL